MSDETKQSGDAPVRPAHYPGFISGIPPGVHVNVKVNTPAPGPATWANYLDVSITEYEVVLTLLQVDEPENGRQESDGSWHAEARGSIVARVACAHDRLDEWIAPLIKASEHIRDNREYLKAVKSSDE